MLSGDRDHTKGTEDDITGLLIKSCLHTLQALCLERRQRGSTYRMEFAQNKFSKGAPRSLVSWLVASSTHHKVLSSSIL